MQALLQDIARLEAELERKGEIIATLADRLAAATRVT